MNNLSKLLLASTITGLLFLSGCGNESEAPGTDSYLDHDNHEGHDHGDDGHEDHNHAEEEQDDHGSEDDLCSVTIASTTLSVNMGGDLEPGAVMHLDIETTAGPEPVAIRVWIGDRAATGTLKSKAMWNSVDYHAEVEVPSELRPGFSLWIEIEAADGERASGAIPING